jgi:AcrR family transcriptional regulator
MDQVAARASVSKTTLYRRWPSKVALVMDVWAQAVELGIPVPDTGSARGDLLAMVSEVAAILDDSMVGHALPSLVDVRFREPTFAVAFGELFAARRALLRTVLQRWVERGELRADVDLGVVLDQLLAPLYYRWLLSGEPIDGELVTSIVEQVLAGCARPPTRRPRPAKARNVKAR